VTTKEDKTMDKTMGKTMGKVRRTAVMTPRNPLWGEFARRLKKAIRADGCDASSLQLSEAILAGMAGVDVERSVEFFRAHGGYCDCEVLSNVDQ
jgi:hypothetical protein